jgi:hypothetical protein
LNCELCCTLLVVAANIPVVFGQGGRGSLPEGAAEQMGGSGLAYTAAAWQQRKSSLRIILFV